MSRLLVQREKKPTAATGKMPREELAKFLMQLSDIYASPIYGNPMLSAALQELAATVKYKESGEAEGNKAKDKKLREQFLEHDSQLKAMDHDSVRDFLNDERKTKGELLGLASARFSMPISQLKRMKILELRQTINAALLHESSIEILSEEANRDGANRKS